MSYSEKNNGWGAYQNKKNENEILKKQLIVQNENSFGERIKIDNNSNNFINLPKKINPFRYPNTIAVDNINININDNINDDDDQDDDDIKECKNAIIKCESKIIEYEEKIKHIKEEYENKLTKYENKKEQLCKIISGFKEIIDDNLNDKTNIIDTNTILDKNTIIDKKNNARPKSLSECFKSDTMFHHYKCNINEFAIYKVTENCIYRCDEKGNIKHNEKFDSLNAFTSNNYIERNKKEGTNRTTRNNAYLECNYKNNITNKWLSCNFIKKNTILNN